MQCTPASYRAVRVVILWYMYLTDNRVHIILYYLSCVFAWPIKDWDPLNNYVHSMAPPTEQLPVRLMVFTSKLQCTFEASSM